MEAAKSFPGSVQKYCDTHEIQASSFYNWRKRLLEARNFEKAKFLPVVISEAKQPAEHPQRALPNAQWVAEVMLHLIRGLA
jgi:transposase-like protein